MTGLIDIVSRLFDLIADAVGGSAVGLMLVVSVVTAAWALKLFQAVTPRARLAAVRDPLLGHIYEMGLYQGDLSVLMRIQADLARTNLRYLVLTLPALLVLAVPMIPTLGQLDSRLAHRPFEPGESTVFSVRLDGSVDPSAVRLEVPEEVAVTAGPVRDAAAGAVSWRLRVEESGRHALTVKAEDHTLGVRNLVADGGLPRLGETSRPGWLHALLHPGAPRLPAGGPLKETTLVLPERHTRYLGLEMSWLVAFMVISLLAGLLLKGPLRVSI
jgi:hypothetical protein